MVADNGQFKVSLCITTYNSSKILARVLPTVATAIQVLARHKKKPIELLLCDDGSTNEEVDHTQELIRDSGFEIRHVYADNQGWSISNSRNNGIREASGEYIIFIDGDCMLHPYFLYDYLNEARRGEMIIAPRTHVLEPHDSFKGCDLFSVFRASLFSRIMKRRSAFRNPFEGGILYPEPTSIQDLETLKSIGLGCNHGYWKDDAMNILGYEETFNSWGAEDADFAYRLLHAGVKLRRFRNKSIVYHLDHDSEHRTPSDHLEALCAEAFRGERIQSRKSILKTTD